MRSFVRTLTLSALLAAALTFTGPAKAAQSQRLSAFTYQSGIPVGIPSSGSFANNGALTGLTAFPTTYASIYLFFPANSICTVGTGGNAAGFYYAQMSSATAGTVFNNTYSSGAPTIPASPTAFACTGPGAYTQSTSVQTLITYTVTGGYLGITGRFSVYDLWSVNNSGNTKTVNTAFGGTTIQTGTLTTSASYEAQQWVTNRGVQNKQVLSPPAVGGFGASATANTFSTVDTSANQNLTALGTLAVATDFIVLESMTMSVYTQYN